MDDVTEIVIPLSPSRVSEFKNCPQLFKFRIIDRLPEPSDIYSMRGTLVHSVLERLMSLESEQRDKSRAKQLLTEIWSEMRADPETSDDIIDIDDELLFLASTDDLLENYFRIEDPRAIEPHESEWWVEHPVDDILLRGIIDRVEIDESGEWILSDYKTGRSPSDNYVLGSFFGLKFYALICWRALGKMPKELRLLHLKEPEVLILVPNERMLEGLERQLFAVAEAIKRAHLTGDWRPRPSYRCAMCPHQAICPAFADVPRESLANEVVI